MRSHDLSRAKAAAVEDIAAKLLQQSMLSPEKAREEAWRQLSATLTQLKNDEQDDDAENENQETLEILAPRIFCALGVAEDRAYQLVRALPADYFSGVDGTD